MSQFVVSARKYRPATFDTVVGQQHVTNTLRNAFKNNHLTQAYLFCGPRGVGKTTCARILAKTLNCSNLTPEFEACNTCEFCQMINSGQSFNMQELDAASNNGVEEMRALIEQVRYAPQSGRYKIYIIDEVHMLSTAAFNAFLKTLEEPPSYAIFILATTEKHKILPTILSRCQIFDFNRITVDDISAQLKYIAGKEQINADEEALHIIAQKADGAMRDALSMFDQIVSSAGNTVTYKDVLANLNVLDYEYFFKITDLMLKGDYSEVLLVFDELLTDGFDGHHFVNGMSGHIRDLMMCKDAVTLKLLTVSNAVKQRYKEQAEACDSEWLMALLDVFNRCDIEYKASRNQRLHVELTLLKACRIKKKFPELTEDFFEIVYEEILKTPGASPIPKPLPVLEHTTAHATTPPAPDKEAPPPSINIPAGVRIIPSIRNIGKKNNDIPKDTASAGNDITLKAMEVSIEDLHKQIRNFADTKIDNTRGNLLFTLTNHMPMLQGNKVVFILDNKNQQEQINEIKADMLAHLHAVLHNNQLSIETTLSERPIEGKSAYTASEKFKVMADHNPELLRLMKLFDLEL